MKKLSICIFAYKQAEQIKAQLDELITYVGNDIEIVVSDDTPDCTIKDLVESYADERLRYVKNEMGAGADGNYLNAIISADSEYVWIFRSSDSAVAEKITDVINILGDKPQCALYFFSSIPGEGLKEKKYEDSIRKEIWYSGTLHPSGYVINKKYCDFDSYKKYILKHFEDYKASNVAFNILQADLGMKGDTLFSSIPAWKYAVTVKREDKATNTPGGKNPFGLEFEYKRYAVMLEYASDIQDKSSEEFISRVIHTYAKQILHVFGKRNSSQDFLSHYGCEKVDFSPYKERKIFSEKTRELLCDFGVDKHLFESQINREAFIYGVIKPTIYKIRNRK